ncbi:unnamed protein product [Adineta ricciae]|uniref:G-protein coupled receptors family 1 profile domain-containing protein n=1 Tax=Adineta ricciae TaxID=249248 RepID=A0A815W3A8_ADIRI|nr:unnamed protein product [Adineta ricciae]
MTLANVSDVQAEINALKASWILFDKVYCFSMIILGTIGHLLSIYIFTRRSIRMNPCARYFLASTFCGWFVVCFGIPYRFLQIVYDINPSGYSKLICKLFNFLFFTSRALTSWIIVLACADRFVASSTSAKMRAWSSIRVTYYAIFVTTIMVGLFYIHVPIFYYVNQNTNTCLAPPGTYSTFYGIWNLFVFSLGPPFSMFILGALTIRNFRQSIKRIAPNNNPDNVTGNGNQIQQRRKAIDQQMIRMLLVQCLVFILTGAPVSIQYIYGAVAILSDPVESTKNNLAWNIIGFISLTGPSSSFYLFTLSSKLFRGELMCLFKGHRELRRGTNIILLHPIQRPYFGNVL